MADTISVRISPGMKDELRKFAKDERLEQTSEAARKLLIQGLNNWHRKKALALFTAGKITLSKAASLAQMDVWEFAEHVKKHSVPWIKEKRFIQKDIAATLR
jgi:predicted HTH domain antitoxin